MTRPSILIAVLVCALPHACIAQSQKAEFVVLRVSLTPANDSCVLVHTRKDLGEILRRVGYQEQELPNIAWEQKGAAVIAPRNASMGPVAYLPTSARQSDVFVSFSRMPVARPSSVYVMEIDRASAMASRCTAYQTISVSPGNLNQISSTTTTTTATTTSTIDNAPQSPRSTLLPKLAFEF